uniref:Uncharacterized protein n=1 Tax=Mycobacterium phage Farewell TaxID=3158893 RepID=A0AAU8GLA6_9CAUD
MLTGPALRTAARLVDRTLNTLWPARHAERGHAAATAAATPLPELASTAVLTTTGCATNRSAGHPTRPRQG